MAEDFEAFELIQEPLSQVELDDFHKRLCDMGLITVGDMYMALTQSKLPHDLDTFVGDFLFSAMLEDGVFDTLDLVALMLDVKAHDEIGVDNWFANYLRRNPAMSIPSRDN